MGIFNSIFRKQKLDAPVLYKKKKKSSLIPELKKIQKHTLPEDVQEQIKEQIYQYQSGDKGENQVRGILQKSHMPMYILHDLYLKDTHQNAQIDLIAVTRKCIFIIECKNYTSDLRISRNGQFTITKKDGSKENISSPVEQNQRHIQVIDQLFPKLKKRCVPIVVFTNVKMPLHAEKASQNIRQQIIKADELISFIQQQNETAKFTELSDAEMKRYADAFRKKHSENPVNYTAKYKDYLNLCPNCRQPVKKGKYGWYCTGKCGIHLDKVYGTPLSDNQVLSLLHGKSIKCKTLKGMTKVFPEMTESTYEGKTALQWKTKFLS